MLKLSEEKINAAIELGLPVILVTRPVVEQIKNHTVVRSIDELKEVI